VLFTTEDAISGIKNLTADAINTINMVATGTATISGMTTVESIKVANINFKNHASVSSFNGNLSSLSNDLSPWLKNTQNEVHLSGFSNDPGFISKLQEVVIDTKWRLKEDGEELRIEKYNGATWEEKFKFS
jgi:hypothetical protein